MFVVTGWLSGHGSLVKISKFLCLVRKISILAEDLTFSVFRSLILLKCFWSTTVLSSRDWPKECCPNFSITKHTLQNCYSVSIALQWHYATIKRITVQNLKHLLFAHITVSACLSVLEGYTQFFTYQKVPM